MKVVLAELEEEHEIEDGSSGGDRTSLARHANQAGQHNVGSGESSVCTREQGRHREGDDGVGEGTAAEPDLGEERSQPFKFCATGTALAPSSGVLTVAVGKRVWILLTSPRIWNWKFDRKVRVIERRMAEKEGQTLTPLVIAHVP